jgi:succinoglycan biosynthesis transport protein ExoP
MTKAHGYSGVLSALRARWWIVLLCALIPVVTALVHHQIEEERYQADALVLFRSTNLDASVLNGSSYFGRSNDPLRAAATNFELVQSPDVAARVAAALGSPWTTKLVTDRMRFAAVGSSDVVKISATDTDAALSAQLANTWASEFVAFRRETDRAQVSEAITLIERDLASSTPETEGARVDELRRSLSQLRVVQALQTGGAEFIQEAEVPTSPSGTPLVLVLLGGGLIGLVVGGITAVLAEKGDRRLRGADEAGAILDLPLLASIPKLRGKDTRAPSALMTAGAREGFHTLALRLRFFDLDSERRVIGIMSGESGEGKTSVALGLGMAYASMGHQVIVVDCDLRRGDMRLRLPIGPGPGLTEVLSNQATLSDAIRDCDLDFATEGFPRSPTPGASASSSAGTLSVLPAGAPPPNPIQMLSSKGLVEILSRLRSSYDHVILDTSPLLRVSDAEALLPALDGFIIVARVQATSSEDLGRIATIISRDRDRALGVVANEISRRDTRSGYYGAAQQAGVAAVDK